MNRRVPVALLGAALLVIGGSAALVLPYARSAAPAAVYYVATDGTDDLPGGTLGDPWVTITYALDHVPDGSTILVRPGTYTGRTRLRGQFTLGVTVRSEVPYQARLRNLSDKVITTYDGCAGITLEGLTSPTADPARFHWWCTSTAAGAART